MAIDAHRTDPLDRLPTPYAAALRWRDAGVPDDVIAERIGLDPVTFPTFMRVAEAKRAAASDDETSDLDLLHSEKRDVEAG